MMQTALSPTEFWVSISGTCVLHTSAGLMFQKPVAVYMVHRANLLLMSILLLLAACTDSVPKELGDMGNLKQISLSDNQLSGEGVSHNICVSRTCCGLLVYAARSGLLVSRGYVLLKQDSTKTCCFRLTGDCRFPRTPILTYVLAGYIHGISLAGLLPK